MEVALTPPPASVVSQEEAVVLSASLIQTKATPPLVDEFVTRQPPLAETPTSRAKEAVPPQVVASTNLPPTALSTAASALSSIPPPMLLSSSTETTGGDSSVKNRASMFAFMPRKNPAYAEPVEGSFFSSRFASVSPLTAITAAYSSNKPKIIPEAKMRQLHWIRLKPSDVRRHIPDFPHPASAQRNDLGFC